MQKQSIKMNKKMENIFRKTERRQSEQKKKKMNNWKQQASRKTKENSTN